MPHSRNVQVRPWTLVLLLWSAGHLQAQAPSGWIQDTAWVFLGPLGSAGGCNPGGATRQNWIAPLDIATLAPGANDEAAIDFNPAESTGWLGVGDEPVWLSLEEQGFLGNDVIDGVSIAQTLAANSGEDVPSTNCMAVFVTYVTYLGAEPFQAVLCDASDDSVQIWVNNTLVREALACRGTATSCAEVTPVVLRPGKNAIKVLLWQGDGGWGFRLRLNRADGPAITDADPDFQFGYDPAGAVSLSSGIISRDASPSDLAQCASRGDLQVTLRGNGVAGPDLTLVETVSGPVEVFDISNGGVFTPATLPANKQPVGSFEDHRSVGGACIDGDTVSNGGSSYTVTGYGTDIWMNGDEFEFAYKELTGDFSVTARVSDRVWAPGSRWGKVGLMARQDLGRYARYSMLQTHGEDQQDADRFAGRQTEGGADNFELAPLPAGEHRDWMRLSRAGSTLTGEMSVDGITWDVIGTQNWGDTAPQSVLVGLAVCPHSEAQGGCLPATITFDDLEIQGGNDPKIPTGRTGGTIRWQNISRAAVNAGLTYKVRGDAVVRFDGRDSERTVVGDQITTVVSSTVAPGIFDVAHDIGSPCVSGQTVYDAGGDSYAVTGGGNDIWQTGDQFQYAYKKISGDFSLVAHVSERTWAPGSRWGKVGIMARQDCTDRSRYAMIQTHGEDPQDFDRFAARPTHGGADNFELSNLSGSEHRDWLRLDRLGNVFFGYFSLDGVSWQQAGKLDWGAGAPDTVLLGLAVNAHSNNNGGCLPATIVFDQVRLTIPSFTVSREIGSADFCPTENESALVVLRGTGDPGPAVAVTETVIGNVRVSEVSNLGRATKIPEPADLSPLGPWEDTRDIGAPCTAGSTTQDAADTYTVTGSGLDIWQNGDQFHYAYRRATGDFDMVAHVQSATWAPGSRWGKAGIMARENHGDRARYSMMQTHGIDAQDQDRFSARRTSGAPDNFEATTLAAGEHREWMRLERVGNAFNGYSSADGIDWQLQGSMNWGDDAPATVLLGLAVCAHGDGCQTATLTFDEVTISGGDGPPSELVQQGWTIKWTAQRAALTGAGINYRLTGNSYAGLSGVADDLPIGGPSSTRLASVKATDLGEFTNAHDVGGPCITGETTHDAGDGSYTIKGGGIDIWQGGDQFQYAYKRWTGDFSMITHVRDRLWAPGSRWGKVGIMAREDCGDRARYSMVQTHGEDQQDSDRFAARPTGGGANNFEQSSLPAGEHRDWLRLDRVGNVVTAYTSADGIVWETLGQNDWGDGTPDTLLLGLAVCAHSDGQSGCEPATIVFDQVKITTTFEESPGTSFHRGDADDNGQLQLTDAVRVLGFLFLGQQPPACFDAADADDNGQIQLTDAVRILGFLFLGQAPPAPPGPPSDPCGRDPTPEDGGTDLGCETYTGC